MRVAWRGAALHRVGRYCAVRHSVAWRASKAESEYWTIYFSGLRWSAVSREIKKRHALERGVSIMESCRFVEVDCRPVCLPFDRLVSERHSTKRI